MTRARSILVVGAALTGASLAQPAWAETPPAEPPVPAEETERALAAGHAALAAYESREWSRALEQFRVADRLAHSPVFTLYMARCERNLGRLVAAQRLFNQVLAEPPTSDAPQAWKRAAEDAKREREALVARIPKLVVQVRGAPPERTTIALDGRTLSREELETPIAVDPGDHTVVAQVKGRKERTRVRVLEGSGDTTVVVDFGGPVAAPGDNVRAPRSKTSTKPPDAGDSGPPVAPIVAFGVGAAGIVTGSILGLLAANRASEIKDRCQGSLCLESDADDGATAKRLADASTIAFVIGGIGLGTGAVLVLLPGDEASRAPSGAVVHVRGRF